MSTRTFSPIAGEYCVGWTIRHRETPSWAAFRATERPYSHSALWIETKISARIVGARMASSRELAPRSERWREGTPKRRLDRPASPVRARRCPVVAVVRRRPCGKASALLDLAGALVDDALDHGADGDRGGDQDGRDDRPLQRRGPELALTPPGLGPLVVGP